MEVRITQNLGSHKDEQFRDELFIPELIWQWRVAEGIGGTRIPETSRRFQTSRREDAALRPVRSMNEEGQLASG